MANNWRTLFVLVGLLVTSPSWAGIYAARYSPTNTLVDEINGTMGGSTARSFTGAARMSHKFFSGATAVSEGSILSSCQVSTPVASIWPERCDPAGMDAALSQWYSWVFLHYSATEQQYSLNTMLSALKNLGSPNVVPIFGQADHWVSVWKIETDAAESITRVHFLDGGAGSLADSSGNSYFDGWVSAGGSTWKNIYHLTLYSVPSTDPYYNRYLNMYEPPPDFVPNEHFRAVAPRGAANRGERITPALVRERALEALRLGGVNENPEMWSTFQNGTPHLPFEVSGVYPDGSNWDYYLVPFLNRDRMLVGMALLSKEDLSYQMAWVPPEPRSFSNLVREQARARAQASLRPGESLSEGTLTWDPSANGAYARSPMSPYYEFQVRGSTGEAHGAVVVRLESGTVHAVDVCQASRRARSSHCN